MIGKKVLRDTNRRRGTETAVENPKTISLSETLLTKCSGTTAAICSKTAADQNGLDILAEGIEDSEDNKTRFFIIRRWQDVQSAESSTIVDETVEMEKYKSLVSFAVSHGEPGALADSLNVFKKYNLNLTSINTRPISKAPWEYIFFIEFMGRKHSDSNEGAVNHALAELGKVATSYRWLGSWPSKFKAS